MSKRNRGAALVATGSEKPTEDQQQLAMQQQSPDIPPHVWALLQEAGEEAARRLFEILRSSAFTRYPASAQKALIELALTRAYGLPVKRSLSVNLESSDADAIAQSLMGLQDALPERQSAAPDAAPDAPAPRGRQTH